MHTHVRTVGLLCALVVALCACGGGGSSSADLPAVTFVAGERYFRVGEHQEFLASRNIIGDDVAQVEALLDKARLEGTRVVRFHVTHLGGMGIRSDGTVDETWAARWDQVFAHAAADGIHVIPVLGVWADWNDGSAGEAWHTWHLNPLNHDAYGGPARSPAELLVAGQPGQTAWLAWMGALVTRWQAHPNVLAWEIFSELDQVTGATRTGAAAFIHSAAAVIHSNDPAGRPVTVSLAITNRWPELYTSSDVDIAQLHAYGPYEALDRTILDVFSAVGDVGKAVLLGESGLDSAGPDGTTATTAPEHARATRHAVWAALVAGAMNGRALWWEDGYDILQNPGDGGAVDFVAQYPAVERPALRVVSGRDLEGFRRVAITLDAGLVGGAVGTSTRVIGWARNEGCEAPGWSCTAAPAGLRWMYLPSEMQKCWETTFFDPATGAKITDGLPYLNPAMFVSDLYAYPDQVAIQLPPLADDIAFVAELTSCGAGASPP